jgi:hypothetical protein
MRGLIALTFLAAGVGLSPAISQEAKEGVGIIGFGNGMRFVDFI